MGEMTQEPTELERAKAEIGRLFGSLERLGGEFQTALARIEELEAANRRLFEENDRLHRRLLRDG